MNIEQVASLVVPVATAIAVLIPILRDRKDLKMSQKVLDKRLDRIEVDILQLKLHDFHLPERERLNAGKRFIDLGGNGGSKVYYEELEAKYRKRVKEKIEGDKP
jgi:hypothetical protein